MFSRMTTPTLRDEIFICIVRILRSTSIAIFMMHNEFGFIEMLIAGLTTETVTFKNTHTLTIEMNLFSISLTIFKRLLMILVIVRRSLLFDFRLIVLVVGFVVILRVTLFTESRFRITYRFLLTSYT